ncbi:GNAT family N-acetyltransferase [Planomonospora parontospora]|uniref:GNAT family N-acetyltransferase n=1 Tax=Planomonospora parontospora TaxID=58119 RepID=UPI00166F8644|nr:GNAT family N-acetyltransferase [Planomonospora parontospora]GGL42404.1 hypothetical protein GCM10014719_49640 [Planomonospora parontospora subsp. antibiotica]GII18397.1 hypothetical protein Ppa05_51230 [Planomonospora parontospora subsp. antibiotica]
MTRRSRVSDVPPSVWARESCPGALFNSADWFGLAEASGTRLTYLTVPGRSPVMLPVHLEAVRPGGGYDHEGSVLRPALGRAADDWAPCLTVGSWNSTLSTGPVRPEPGAETDPDTVGELVEEALRLADERGARSVAWPFLTGEAAASLTGLLPERVLALRCRPSTLLTITAPTFEDHLASLSPRKRQNLLYEERRLTREPFTLGAEKLSGIVDEVADLITLGRERRDGHADRDRTASLLNAQSTVLGERMLVFTARLRGRLAAVTTAAASHGGLYIRSYGACDELVERSGVYFTLTCHLPLRYAFDHGLRWLHSGIGAYEAKARRGFQLVPLWTVFIRPGPVTAGQRVRAETWNSTSDADWRGWYAAKLNTDLPDDWRWPGGAG